MIKFDDLTVGMTVYNAYVGYRPEKWKVVKKTAKQCVIESCSERWKRTFKDGDLQTFTSFIECKEAKLAELMRMKQSQLKHINDQIERVQNMVER